MPTASSPLKLLLDTNIWMDAFWGARPGHGAARAVIDAALEKDAMLLYAVPSLKDIYYILGASFKRAARDDSGTLSEDAAHAAEEAAFGCIEAIECIATAVGADAHDVRLAVKYRSLHRDFEDDLIMAAAQRAQVHYLVTNDERLLKHAVVPALSAPDMAVYLNELA